MPLQPAHELLGSGLRPAASDDAFVRDTVDWILRYAIERNDLGELLTEVSRRLLRHGLPLWRTSLDMPTLDPNSRAVMHKWWRDRATDYERLPHGPEQAEVFQNSVVYHLIEGNLDRKRWRLEEKHEVSRFALLESLQGDGATDYFLYLVKFGEAPDILQGVAISIASDQPGGFRDSDLAIVDKIIPALGLAARHANAAETAEKALSVYIGPNSARRVLAGQILRGGSEVVSAAILLADLRGFTALVEREDPVRVVAWLNEHFEAVGAAVTSHDGEILKFIGDGLLAVFPADGEDGAGFACRTALKAARDAQAANDAVNKRRLRAGEPQLSVDIALHFGGVVYGNVGASSRLDFTVIGRAVNEVSRMEALCDEVGRRIVASEAVANRCPEELELLGEFTLRGVQGTHRIFGLW